MSLSWLKCPLKRPASAEPERQGCLWQPKPFRPLRDGQRAALIRQKDVGSHVVALLPARLPATILRTVRTIIVDAAKRILVWRSPAHVGQEILKAVPPALAYRGPASGVTGLGNRAVAPFNHVCPGGILDAPVARAAFAVDRASTPSRDSRFSRQAAAGPDTTAPEIVPENDGVSTAITPAQPVSRSTKGLDRYQAREPVPGNVFEAGMRWPRTAASHRVDPSFAVVSGRRVPQAPSAVLLSSTPAAGWPQP